MDEETICHRTPSNTEEFELPRRHEREGTAHKQPIGRTLDESSLNAANDEVSRDGPVRAQAQLRAEPLDAGFELRDRRRRIHHAEIDRQVRHLLHVPVAIVIAQSPRPVPAVRREEHRRLGGVHPREEVRIVREVGDAVVRDAAHGLVHREHPLDRRVRLVPRAVGREADEVRRLEESTEGVLAVARVLGDAGHRVGMKHLNEQGSESADQHRRKIAVDRSRNAVEGEVRLFGVVATRWWLLRQADGPADIAIDAPTQLR